MVDIAFYLVSETIARRSGVIQSRYRTTDGRFILDTKDLSNIRLTSEEFINGLDGVEMITKQEAMILIKENNYQMGLPVNAMSQSVVTEETEQQSDVTTETNETEVVTEPETPESEEQTESEQEPTETTETTEESSAEESGNSEQETESETTNEEEE